MTFAGLVKSKLDFIKEVTGFPESFCLLIKRNKVPDHITIHSGVYCPSNTVLRKVIVEKIEKFKQEVN